MLHHNCQPNETTLDLIQQPKLSMKLEVTHTLVCLGGLGGPKPKMCGPYVGTLVK